MPNLPTKRAVGRAVGKPCATQRDIDRTESTDGTDLDGDRIDRTEYLPECLARLICGKAAFGLARPGRRCEADWRGRM
eukprot:15454814-Alexandrium_andersonii.AAC.1